MPEYSTEERLKFHYLYWYYYGKKLSYEGVAIRINALVDLLRLVSEYEDEKKNDS